METPDEGRIALIFLRYENWKSYLRFYPVTCLILLINIVMFIVLAAQGGSQNNLTLIRYGALINEPPFTDQLWRYVSAMFLHAGFDHLLFNSFAILVFAPPLERLLGSFRYVLLYLVTGIVGNVMSIAHYNMVAETTISVGASGAIYGIYGAFLYVALFQRSLMDEASRKTLYTLLGFGILFSFAVANINWTAHFGGLLSGFFLYGLMIRLTGQRKRH